MELIKLNLSNNNKLSELEKEILDIAEDIPFGNSDFQNRLASVNNEISPHRALRASCLRIMDRIQALRECYFSLREKSVEIKKLERDYNNTKDELEKELIEIKIERIQSGMEYTKKLIKDAVKEIESLYPVVKSIGKMSREQFESLEKDFFQRKYEMIIKGINEAHLVLQEFNQEDDLYSRIIKKQFINNIEDKSKNYE